MGFTLGKSQRIKSRKLIEQMFEEGKAVKNYPFRAVFLEQHEGGFQMAVSVPKKRLKKAVDRNKVKRMVREAYRLQSPEIFQEASEASFAIMIIYMGNEVPDYSLVSTKIKGLLQRFVKEIQST